MSILGGHMYILCANMYIVSANMYIVGADRYHYGTNMQPLGTKVYLLKWYSPSDSFCTVFFWECIAICDYNTILHFVYCI